MVSPRTKSVTWVARAATGKSDGISPALIPSRKRRSTSAAARDRVLQEPLNLSVVHKRRDAHEKTAPADPFSVALSTAYLRKLAIESRRLCGERSAFAR
jgi:hypothetical protein